MIVFHIETIMAIRSVIIISMYILKKNKDKRSYILHKLHIY